MPDELFRMLYGGGLMDTWGPLVTIIALLVVGLVYFLAPAMGYTTYNRGLLLGAVWVLIAKMGLAIFKTGIIFLQFMDHSSGGATSPSSGKDEMMMYLLFSMLESGIFILAMALFAGGLASLRRDRERDRDRDLPLAQPPRFPND